MSFPNQDNGTIPVVQGVAVVDPPSSSSPPNAYEPPPYQPNHIYYPQQQQQEQYYANAHAPVQQTMEHAHFGYPHAPEQPLQQPYCSHHQQQYTKQQQQTQPYYNQQQQQHQPQQYQPQIQTALAETKRLIIKQRFEPIEALAYATANAINMSVLGNLGEIANKYDVFTDDGGDKFRVIEQSEYLGLTGRCCCNPNHQLQLHVYAPDVFSNTSEVMVFDRPCKCGQCCSCCNICRQEMIAYDGNSENQIGYIKQPFLGGGLTPALQVMERQGDDEPYATIQSDAICCIAGLCCDHTFVVKDARTGDRIGTIVKLKPDSVGQFSQEIVSDSADVFSIEFQNKDLDINKKATLFGALHLIDYMFFENEGQGTVDLVNQQVSYKLCDLYCCGCVVPCKCDCGRRENNHHNEGGYY